MKPEMEEKRIQLLLEEIKRLNAKLARTEELLESCRELSWQRAQELLELKRGK